MSKIDDLNAAVQGVQGDVSALQAVITQIDTDVQTAIADIEATSGTGLQQPISNLQVIHTNLQALAASLTSADTSLEAAENPPATPAAPDTPPATPPATA